MTAFKPEVREFLNMWLEGESASDILDWCLEHNLINRAELRRVLMHIYLNHKDDPDMREFAFKAKRAADSL